MDRATSDLGQRWQNLRRERDELRAENERLREAFANSEAACLIQVQTVRAENDLLRIAEQRRREELETAMAEIVRLENDNGRLAECWTTEQEAHQQTHAENERLRALVQRHITEHHYLVCGSDQNAC